MKPSMRRIHRLLAPSLGAAALLVAVSVAHADEIESTPVEVPPAPIAAPELPPRSSLAEAMTDVPPARRDEGFQSAIDFWNSRRPWRYGTQYLFLFTRGMQEAGLPRAARYALWTLTVPADVAYLPIGAVGGLFGN